MKEPASAFTLAKLEGLVAVLTDNAPPASRLWVHSMLEVRRLAEFLGFECPVPPHLQPVDSFMGIPITASEHIRSGHAVLIVQSDPLKVYTFKVPR